MWVVDQDQMNPHVAYKGYVVRVPHNLQLAVTYRIFSGRLRYIHLIKKDVELELGCNATIGSHVERLRRRVRGSAREKYSYS